MKIYKNDRIILFSIILFWLIVLVVLLSSCQKVRDIQVPTNNEAKIKEELSWKLNHTIFDSVRTEYYRSTVYDSCNNENINFRGWTTYSIKQTDINRTQYLLYVINYNGIIGIGEISKTRYHGGGIVRSSVLTVQEFSHVDTMYIPVRGSNEVTMQIDSIFVVSKIVGRDSYKLRFISNHNIIIYSQKNLYKEIDGEVVIDCTGNPITEYCKNY